MLRILWNSKSAMAANQEKLEVISNNLSNVGTDGYKKVDVSFKDLVYESLERTGYPISENENRTAEITTGTGVKTSEWTRDNRQGVLQETNNSSDLAIDGKGYFQLTRPNGEIVYSRAGKFNVDAEGRLVDLSGNILNIEYNEGINPEDYRFSKDNFHVYENGRVSVDVGNSFVEVGQIALYDALGTNSFISVGDSLYVPSEDAEVYQVEDSNIIQGMIEGSNVDMVSEMTELILTQRAFELGSKGIKIADEMWGMVNNLRGR